MSKYTELLSEYLENNELPTIFDEIAGFKEQFTIYFLDREIGFETEDLFKFKLENYANVLIPLYKVRLQQLTQAITNANNPIKVFYDKYTTTFNIIPGKIKKVNAVSKTDQKTNKYKFSWSASKGATKYVIQTKKYTNENYKTVKTTKAKSCTIKVNSSMTGESTYVQVYGIKKVKGKTYKSAPVNFWTSCNYSSFTKRYHIYVYR